jgi:ankyrin repeat protein
MRQLVEAKHVKAAVIYRVVTTLVVCMFPEIVSAGVAASLWQLQEGTPLMIAARDGNLAKVQELLSKGHNVNERNKRDEATPLIFASSAGRTEVVRVLLKRGADPRLCAWGNTCPMWWATRSGSYETVKLLLESGADVNKQPSPSTLESPTLQIAAGGGLADLVKLLLDHGIKIDYTNYFEENTALVSAVVQGHADVAQLLIERGANLGKVTEVPYSGEITALEYAKKKGHRAAVEVVEAALRSDKYNRPKYSVNSIIDKLYRDPAFDLSAQDKDLVQFLRKQTKETLRRVRNTIFARKNYQFDDPQLTDYFRKRFPSYKPTTLKYEMSEIDKRNIKYLKDIEEYRAARDAAG